MNDNVEKREVEELLGCTITDEQFEEALKYARHKQAYIYQREPRTPSINDIRAAEARKYKYGLVAGHNGTICKYTINGPVNYINADIYLEKANALLYNGDIDSLKATLEELSKNGVDLEVF